MDLLTQFYVTIALMGVSFGLGFYVGERGTAGVQIDMSNIKNDISAIKGKLDGTPKATIVTPVASPKATDTVTVGVTPSI
jgi:hypothetical protein